MKLELEQAQNWLNEFFESIIENKDLLNELDTAIGDGDHGTNMERGVKAAQEALQNKPATDVAKLYMTTAMSLVNKVGGASGPLYGTAFMDMAKAVKSENIELADLIQIGTDGIKRRGESDVKMKTMIDVWQPVADGLSDDKLNSEVIEKALNDTKDIVATKGRASYLGEQSVGHLDPGAKSSELLFKALLNQI
ncbi:dihydroxyacetone kinase subunit DhaL [Companilactobacillus metriopterae]|uniref:dihydroxyacetone kinase subunit DhaL n=1 Tax=Companilactobacillus metriopterae TaxID=1909267 RepID=UPI00100C16CF|nr:dihydroxyacetone kinase subunit DhaL [Companilactobacillus metriopterae]